jgi:hypothetical protein
MAAVDRLVEAMPRVRSSQALMRVSAVLAHQLLDDLAPGSVRDELAAVTPSSKSPVANAVFSTVLGELIVNELAS